MPSAAETTSLSGEWEFRLDPADEGVAKRWYDADTGFEHRITVPGAWNAQGFGFTEPADLRAYEAQRRAELAPLRARRMIVLGDEPEAERVFHVFPGPAWYRTTTVIPAGWTGAALVFTGIHRYATVWIDGRLAATHRSYLAPLTIDLAEFAAPGDEITVVVRVDARRDRTADPLFGCQDTLDFVHTEWGGIHHHVRLEQVKPERLDDVFVIPRLTDRRVDVTATVAGRASYVVAEVANAAGEVVGRATGTPDRDGRIAVAVPLDELHPWAPATPYLYRLRLTTDAGAARRVRFGMRELTVDGDQFLLNGRPFFLRAYGDDCIFPETIAPPADIAEYRRRLGIARDYGFNYVRLHSWVPPEEYLDAADEIGMLVQPELPLAGWHFVPETTEAEEFAVTQWIDLIRRYRNHPSVAVWCMGNELYESFGAAGRMYRLARELDPTRLVIESDGSRLDAMDRPTLDFLSVPFDEGRSMGFGDGKYDLTERPEKPVVAHEAGYFQSLPDPAGLHRFRDGLSPYWLREVSERLEQKGWHGRYAEDLETSRRLQATCLKTNIEAARRAGLAGIAVWLLQDYPNCAEGVLDMWYGQKLLTAAEFRRFNAPAVLLLDLDRRSLTCGERVRAGLVLSCFEVDRPRAATLQWTLRHGDQEIASGTQHDVRITAGVHPIGYAELELPDLHTAAKLSLTAELDGSELRAENDWDLWLYPRPSDGDKHNDRVLVTARMTPTAQDRLAAGGRVLLLDPEPPFRTESTTYRPASWDGTGHHGLSFDPSHPALRGMPADGWGDLQFHRMMRGSKSVLLDDIEAESIITCIDSPTRMALRSHLFEQRVGPGRLLVCGLDLTGSIEDGDPAATYLLDQLVNYLASG